MKHAKETKVNFLKVAIKLILGVIIIALLFLSYYKFIYLKTDEALEDITEKNERLILKSNYEENREKTIEFKFNNNKLNEVDILEIYKNVDQYNMKKEIYAKISGIEILNLNDDELSIYYKKTSFGSDEGASYEEIYNKYTGIVGAYEVVK